MSGMVGARRHADVAQFSVSGLGGGVAVAQKQSLNCFRYAEPLAARPEGSRTYSSPPRSFPVVLINLQLTLQWIRVTRDEW